MHDNSTRLSGRISVVALTAVFLLASCAAIRKGAPTIAHVHIGHSLTGWVETPNKLGLLVTAEQEAIIAQANSELLIEAAGKSELERSKLYLSNIGNALDPKTHPEGNGKGYGLRRAASGAIFHLTFAAESPDASPNVITSVERTSVIAQRVLEKIDETLVLVEEALKIDEPEILVELGKEIKNLTGDIAGGPSKASTDAYGLYEFRKDIEKMVDREDPPYTTVGSWYLFNLIRLTDGSWSFRKAASGNDNSDSSSY